MLRKIVCFVLPFLCVQILCAITVLLYCSLSIDLREGKNERRILVKEISMLIVWTLSHMSVFFACVLVGIIS